MIFNPLSLHGAFTIDVQPLQDNRGFFTRTFCEREFAEHKLEQHFVQANHSGSHGKGVIRGMHFQHAPFCEVKLVKCIAGAIFDVEFVINVFASSKDDALNVRNNYENTLKRGIALINDDYLGGSGSRGYGQISISLNQPEEKTYGN